MAHVVETQGRDKEPEGTEMSEEWKVNEDRIYTFGMDEGSRAVVKDWYDYVDKMNRLTKDWPTFDNAWAGPALTQMMFM